MKRIHVTFTFTDDDLDLALRALAHHWEQASRVTQSQLRTFLQHSAESVVDDVMYDYQKHLDAKEDNR